MAAKRVIIIGAGPAGLSAAYELLRRGKSYYEVIVLEAGPTVGGLERNYIFGENIIDIGGHCFDFKDDRVREFAGNFLKNTEKPAYDYKIIEKIKSSSFGGIDPDRIDDVMIKRKRCESFCKGGKMYAYPFDFSLKALGKLFPLSAGLCLGSKVKAKIFPEREHSMQDFYINSYGKTVYDKIIAGYAEKVLGKHPAEVLCLKDTKDLPGLFFEKKDKQDPNDFYRYPKFGAGQLWIKVAEKIKEMGGFIFCNCPVLSITHSSSAITSLHYCHNGAENDIDADIVISSMPIKDLLGGFVLPPPEDILKLANKLFCRDMQVIALLLRELKPKAPLAYSLGELLGENTVHFTDSSIKLARMQIYNNRSPYMVRHPHSTVCIGLEYFCRENDMYWQMSDREMISLAVSELEKEGIIDRNQIIDECRIRIKRALPVYSADYSGFEKVRAYLDGFYNLYCIGQKGQHRCHNTENTILTAFEAVDNILYRRTNKAGLWSINT